MPNNSEIDPALVQALQEDRWQDLEGLCGRSVDLNLVTVSHQCAIKYVISRTAFDELLRLGARADRDTLRVASAGRLWGTPEVIQWLLDLGVPSNYFSEQRKVSEISVVLPCAAAAWAGAPKRLAILLRNGANPNLYVYKDQFFPIHLAAMSTDVRSEGPSEIEEIMVQMWDSWRRTDWNHHRDAIELLCLNGAAVDAREARGRTALMLAAERGDEQTVGLLLKHGADPGAVCRKGRSALDWVTNSNHHMSGSANRERTMQLLTAAMAMSCEVTDPATGEIYRRVRPEDLAVLSRKFD